MTVDFLFKFPTRQRRKKFFNVLDLYYNSLSGKHSYKFIISMDKDDVDMNNDRVKRKLNTYENLEYYFGDNKSKIEAINANMKNVENFKIIYNISDDMIPKEKNLDSIIYNDMMKYFRNLDGCLHYNDGRVGKRLNTLVIMGKKLYDYFGYVYHPDYKSLWCDNEFHTITKQMKKTKYIDRVIVRHEWPGANGDKLYRRNENLYTRDKKIFEKRRLLGFPKKSIL